LNIGDWLFNAKRLQRAQHNIGVASGKELYRNSADRKPATMRCARWFILLLQGKVEIASHARSILESKSIYDPIVIQVIPQMPPAPLPPETLQKPKTASSGRKFIVTSFGGS